ncbi:MAG: hypothetical protein HY319_18420 [Armatimonadetes bacterium]|nr:hypothetical protein [Armatimonadota bacterium]
MEPLDLLVIRAGFAALERERILARLELAPDLVRQGTGSSPVGLLPSRSVEEAPWT